MPKKIKKEELEKQLEEERKKSETYLNQYKYLKADFENYQKIIERDKKNIIETASKKIIEDLLPILDDIESAIEKTNDQKGKEGLIMIRDKIIKILESHGLKPIEAVGKKFDPFYHEVMMVEDGEENDIVIQEFQKGYMLNNKVIRHSKVKISKRGDDDGN